MKSFALKVLCQGLNLLVKYLKMTTNRLVVYKTGRYG